MYVYRTIYLFSNVLLPPFRHWDGSLNDIYLNPNRGSLLKYELTCMTKTLNFLPYFLIGMEYRLTKQKL